ncbi:MAG: HIT domain-containing protein [Thermomicrobiales bacterium]
MTYVGGARQDGCVFCNALHAAADADRLILCRGRQAFAILNLYPYNTGHALVVPCQHTAELEELDAGARAELFELANLLVEVSKRVFRCDGFNLGMNIGAVAGAGVAEHLHLHVVPRWTGDANFMPILANTTVMPELLPVTYARLRAELEGLIAQRERGAALQAGGIVILQERGMVALRRGRTGDIVLPKGHVEPGETLAQTALREIREETGIDATLAGWAGSAEFRFPADHPGSPLFHAAYFVATGTATGELDAHLQTDTLLVPIAEAAQRITIPELRAIVERATPFLAHINGGAE